jgi:hypothetical protein
MSRLERALMHLLIKLRKRPLNSRKPYLPWGHPGTLPSAKPLSHMLRQPHNEAYNAV